MGVPAPPTPRQREDFAMDLVFPDREAADMSVETPLRAAIRDADRQDESAAVAAILAASDIPAAARDRIAATARRLVETVRRERLGKGGLDALLHEYALSSPEGVALMCLAEALLRIPDAETVDKLIRDKIAGADWQSHLVHSGSLFVNASTWALMLTGRLLRPDSDNDLGDVLRRLVARSSEPVWRQAVTAAMRILAGQFVIGRTIEEALDRAAAGRPVEAAPGISVKLSALHPRYEIAQHERIMRELLPSLLGLARH